MNGIRWLLLTTFAAALAAVRVARGGNTSERSTALLRMHCEFVDAFVDSQGFGKRRVTPMMVRMRHYQFEGVGEDGRCVLDVELVGVARHDPPVVHGASFMGFQHRDDHAAGSVPPTSARGLQAWERVALSALVAGADIVVHAGPDGERVMGPIRARAECLACHRDRRQGDVLGALSYGLGRIAVSPESPEWRSYRP